MTPFIPDSLDLTYSQALSNGYDLLQLKYDGIYGRLEVSPAHTTVFSKTNKPKGTISLKGHGSVDIRGEYMYGRQWSLKAERAGKVYLYDMAECQGEDITSFCYSDRYAILRAWHSEVKSPLLQLVQSFPIQEYPRIWKEEVDTGKFEGVVFRKSGADFYAPIGRQKKVVTLDFVCTGFYEGEGRLSGSLGGIICGAWKEGKLVEFCRVGGGFTDGERSAIWAHQAEHEGRVLELVCTGTTDDGKPNHPRFLRWRDDKPSTDCII